MKQVFSSIWLTESQDFALRLLNSIEASTFDRLSKKTVYVFFRADDIGVPGIQFARLMKIFTRFHAPISLAVVPAWLTAVRWEALEKICQKNIKRICWYQHGWRHANHEIQGKKQEFGAVRSITNILHDLVQGRRRLRRLVKDLFYPAFTPPWNRCSQTTLEKLLTLEYQAISRYRGASPPAPSGLPDFPVNVDLHTRKEADPVEGWENLSKEMERAISGGYCGIMIHHRRMNGNAFAFLENLLEILLQSEVFHLVTLKDLAEMRKA